MELVAVLVVLAAVELEVVLDLTVVVVLVELEVIDAVEVGAELAVVELELWTDDECVLDVCLLAVVVDPVKGVENEVSEMDEETVVGPVLLLP